MILRITQNTKASEEGTLIGKNEKLPLQASLFLDL